VLANKSGVQVCCAANMKRLRAGILVSDEYNLENVELLIYDTLRDAGNEVGADSPPRWAPRVVVQPTLCRDDRPSMHFTAELMSRRM